jgi:hypothetical protein
MKARQQASTTHPILFLMVDSSDHITGKPGLSPTVTISKDGGAFGSPSGAVTELANGWYALAGNATDRNTLGELVVHAEATGADPVDERYEIVVYDPFVRVAANTEQWNGGALPTAFAASNMPTFPANFATLSIDTSGRVTYVNTAPLDASGVRSAVGLAAANLDTQLGGIAAKTINLPASPASDGNVSAVGAAVLGVQEDTEAIQAAIAAGVPVSDKTGFSLTSAYDAAKAAASQSSVTAIGTAVTAIQAILAGITSLAAWLRCLCRKSTPDATALSEINLGGGAFSPTTDSEEAIRDRGDVAWTTGAGGGTGSTTVNVLPFQSSADNSGRLSPTYLTAYQGCRIQALLAIRDRDGNPVDLSGKTLSLVAWAKSASPTAAWTLRSDGDNPELTIGGTDSNQVTIDGSDTHTATAAQYEWRLYDVAADVALATGVLRIEPGAV